MLSCRRTVWKNLDNSINSQHHLAVAFAYLTDVRMIQLATDSRLTLQLLKIARRELFGVDNFGSILEPGAFLHAPTYHGEGASVGGKDKRKQQQRLVLIWWSNIVEGMLAAPTFHSCHRAGRCRAPPRPGHSHIRTTVMDDSIEYHSACS